MELLIPGLILVALMAYVSTRIKRSAARAFEAETVETDEFVIQKPEGFLNVLNGDPKFAFQAYSKEFGEDADRNIRAATASLKIIQGSAIDDQVARIRSMPDEITNEVSEVIGEKLYRVVEGQRTEGGTKYRVVYKLAERGGTVYEFEVKAVASAVEPTRRAEALLDSFELK
jgi:hypothetical protein